MEIAYKAYRESCMKQMQCVKQFKCFKEARTLVGEDARSVQPSTITDEHVERVKCCDSFKLSFNCLSSFAQVMGIRTGSCNQILTEKNSDASHSCKNLVSDNQKEDCVEISQELVAYANGYEIFFYEYHNRRRDVRLCL